MVAGALEGDVIAAFPSIVAVWAAGGWGPVDSHELPSMWAAVGLESGVSP